MRGWELDLCCSGWARRTLAQPRTRASHRTRKFYGRFLQLWANGTTLDNFGTRSCRRLLKLREAYTRTYRG
ncbi:hypothetical protein BU23DRAFT_62919 [Bimuria novae-zelandiae CBS 107.79]|uniref:Uncharacterized protein n=1 Tax=Bimuria novae-zelandiae CBS 107.79 TaxID=1447943 RepID=A0A6A5UTF7_9PLEO|nr:hypothetical protein BU23DRAFT_62919 [Bimuria novae-zelandiae CBS 107.79]